MMQAAITIRFGDQMHEDDFEPSPASLLQAEIERDPLVIGTARVIGWLIVVFVAGALIWFGVRG